ncbi:IS66 family transposase [Lactobacillus johnsonii]
MSIQRQDLVNWQIKYTEYYFKPLYDLLKERLLKQEVLLTDETRYRVLESEPAKTYYWTFLSSKQVSSSLADTLVLSL